MTGSARADARVPATRRASVVGIGVVAPGALDVPTLERALVKGRSFAEQLDFSIPGCDVRLGCPVVGFDPVAVMNARDVRRNDRATHLAVGAGIQAWEHARAHELDGERVAMVVGVGAAGLATLSELQSGGGHLRVGPYSIPASMPNSTASYLGRLFGATGPSLTVSGACAVGTQAIAEGTRLIRDDSADVVLCVGTDALLIPYAIAGFNRMGALSSGIRRGASNSRPFDATRDGFVLGEGAGAVVLEEQSHARSRSVPVLARIAGLGMTSDGYHAVQPRPDGACIRRCMELAIRESGWLPSDIRHVNAHGSSTVLNDSIEGEAIRAVCGPTTPITANKGAFGHLLGGTGIVEVIASIRAMRSGLVPPIANVETLDPAIPVDLVAGAPRTIGMGPFLKNSFAFGGLNVSIVVEPDRAA